MVLNTIYENSSLKCWYVGAGAGNAEIDVDEKLPDL